MLQYLFDSSKAVSVLHCGHTIHLECLYEMRAHKQYVLMLHTHFSTRSRLSQSQRNGDAKLRRIFQVLMPGLPEVFL
jgi:hypothetical protein